MNHLDNVYLYNVDDLQTIANDYLDQRKEEIAKCEAIIEEKARGVVGESERRGSCCVKYSAEAKHV